MRMAHEGSVKRGCIKAIRGPWIVQRTKTDGSIITKFRNPSDRERQNNIQRERNRRAITQRIFAGLRAHGNYKLPKQADSNHLLKALCEEAGWHVLDDGTIFKKKNLVAMANPSIVGSVEGFGNTHYEDSCIDLQSANGSGMGPGHEYSSFGQKMRDDLNLCLSL